MVGGLGAYHGERKVVETGLLCFDQISCHTHAPMFFLNTLVASDTMGKG
jgi:hypothetical protein